MAINSFSLSQKTKKLYRILPVNTSVYICMYVACDNSIKISGSKYFMYRSKSGKNSGTHGLLALWRGGREVPMCYV